MSDSHDHQEKKPEGFLDTDFDSTVGGFGILWVSICLITIFLVLFLG